MLMGEVDALYHAQSQHPDPELWVLELCLCCRKVPIEIAKLNVSISSCRLIICLLALSVFSSIILSLNFFLSIF